MKNNSYTTIQKKYPGKLVAISESEGKVVAFGKTTKEVERQLKEKKLNPKNYLFLGPVERYNQISVY